MTSRGLAEKICRVLLDAGYQAYLVGGSVRDLVLGREPGDFDVATDALPGRVESLFPGSLTVGAKFGVVMVVEDGAEVEVATFRSDVGSSDGRHPDSVVYTGNVAEDVRRRDFTINALLLDPRNGEIIDLVAGRADLAAGIVRAIGDPDKRFAEDKLRMMRAVRFAARFGFEIEPETFAAIRRLAHAVHQVSAERLRDECTRLLTEGAAGRGFELLDAAGLLAFVLPEVARMKGVEQPPEFHPEGDVWIHTRMMLEALPRGAAPAFAWGVLLHDVGKPPTFTPAASGERIRFDNHVEVGAAIAEEICRRLRFSNADTEQIVALVRNHLRFKDVQQMRPATLKRFIRLPHFEQHMELHRLDCLASHGSLASYQFVRRFIDETPAEAVRPPRLVTGEDLKQRGLAPGPLFGRILRAVEEAQLEGAVQTREEAERLIDDILKGSSGKSAKWTS
ncbi:MAG TPA: CCA tRNA nucleotidyltransferase [Candidatus Acidoferrales bacterium]|nr:CCA tRNA nucleotidyltransferase [Candidatus Acidoferrales bacterium]